VSGTQYRVELIPAARRQLRKLDQKVAQRVLPAIEDLKSEPRPPGCRAMTGQPGRWRIRVGDYRVVYQIDDDIVLVLVVIIAHRKEAYR